MQLTLHLTENCNLRCNYCFAGDKIRGSMTLETALKALDLALQRGAPKLAVTFFGGEPLLCKDRLKEIVNNYNAHPAIKEAKISISYNITTNGTLLDEDFVNFALQNKIFIALSIDGIELANRHRVYADGRSAFEKIESGLNLLAKRIPSFATWSVVTPENMGTVKESMEFLYDHGVRIFILATALERGWQEKDFITLEKQYNRVADFYIEKAQSGGRFFLAPLDTKIRQHTQGPEKSTTCNIGIDSMSIAPDGRIYPCQSFVNQGEERDHCIGHVDKGMTEMRDVLNTQSKAEPLPCVACEIRDRCNSKCACLNFQITGRIGEISPIVCAYEKMLVRTADKVGRKLVRKKNSWFINKHYNRSYDLMKIIEDLLHEKMDDALWANPPKTASARN